MHTLLNASNREKAAFTPAQWMQYDREWREWKSDNEEAFTQTLKNCFNATPHEIEHARAFFRTWTPHRTQPGYHDNYSHAQASMEKTTAVLAAQDELRSALE